VAVHVTCRRGSSCGSIACVVLFLVVPGCAWRVIPPEVADGVPVVLSQYAWHTRLALPDGTAAFDEYGFGEWNFYGLEREGFFSGVRAITGQGKGAISRRELPYTLSESEYARAAGSNRSVILYVERGRAEGLRSELEHRWQSAPSRVVRAWDGIPVSRDPAPYHLFANSNQVVANWLRRLGCRVRGNTLTSRFKVITASDASVRQSPQQRDGASPWSRDRESSRPSR
jgi:hypothetical protein